MQYEPTEEEARAAGNRAALKNPIDKSDVDLLFSVGLLGLAMREISTLGVEVERKALIHIITGHNALCDLAKRPDQFIKVEL